jgi:hypothetical protein
MRGKRKDCRRMILLFALTCSVSFSLSRLLKIKNQNTQKYRPVTGVRAGRAGAALPGWLPLGSHTSNVVSALQNWTPNFPSYPAGHGAFGATAFQLVRLFYGVPAGAAGWGPDTVYSGTFVSGEFNGETFNNSGVVRPLVLRGYKDGGMWKAILDNCNSRTFLGVRKPFFVFFFFSVFPFFIFRSPRNAKTPQRTDLPFPPAADTPHLRLVLPQGRQPFGPGPDEERW